MLATLAKLGKKLGERGPMNKTKRNRPQISYDCHCMSVNSFGYDLESEVEKMGSDEHMRK